MKVAIFILILTSFLISACGATESSSPNSIASTRIYDIPTSARENIVQATNTKLVVTTPTKISPTYTQVQSTKPSATKVLPSATKLLPTQTKFLPTTAPPTIKSTSVPGCPNGCTVPPSGCLIKGNISVNTGEKIYHMPGQRYYEDTIITPSKGERWFCTEAEAIANGWRKSKV